MATKRKTGPKRKPRIKGKLIKSESKITKYHIDEICDYIKHGSFLDMACPLVGVDTWALHSMISKKGRLSEYAQDQIIIAEAEREERLLKRMLNEDTKNAKILQDHLKNTSVRYNKALQMRIEYEMYGFLTVLNKVLPKEQMKDVLMALRNEDPYKLLDQIDAEYVIETEPKRVRDYND